MPVEAEVYRVVRRETLHGEWVYDDHGSYFRNGGGAETLPAVYATREAAEEACAALNATVFDAMAGDYGGVFGPIDDVLRSNLEEWALRSDMPWPVFCDYCADHKIPRPEIEELDRDGSVVPIVDWAEAVELINNGPPSAETLRDWWDTLDIESVGPVLRVALPGPRLYSVTVERVTDTMLEVFRRNADTTGALTGTTVVPVSFVTAARLLADNMTTRNDPDLETAVRVVLAFQPKGSSG